jgi:hypothetical protein
MALPVHVATPGAQTGQYTATALLGTHAESDPIRRQSVTIVARNLVDEAQTVIKRQLARTFQLSWT